MTGTSEYFEMREEYLGELREIGALNHHGQLRQDIVRGIRDSKFRPVEGGPLDEYCREHPDDRLCWVVGLRQTIEEVFEIRLNYMARLEERDLVSIQRGLTDMMIGAASTVADLPPWVDPEDLPP